MEGSLHSDFGKAEKPPKMSLWQFLHLASGPFPSDISKGSKGPGTTLSFGPCGIESSWWWGPTPAQASGMPGVSWEIWSFTANKRGQDRRSGSLMNCMLKEIHILPVAWLYAGTCFFNGDRNQTFWQDRVLLRAMYVLVSLKLLHQKCAWFEKPQLCWGMMEMSLILRCSWSKIFHTVSCQGSVRTSVEILVMKSYCCPVLVWLASMQI